MQSEIIKFDPALFETHTAVLGKTGSGKTNTAKVLIEDLFAAGRRVCILDPIKSDWWGLKSSADGKSPGLPFVIVGGPRADLPLPASSGAAIGRMVASGALPHVIIDMSELRPHESGRWYADFAEALFRHNSGAMHLVLEEADFFAPKEKAGDGEESMRVHWSSRLARAGRSKGIRLVVSCQRTQKLHNDVLGSCEVLVSHRLVFPADQKPVLDWLKSSASKDTTQQISESLAKLATGECWFYAPEQGVLQRQRVRKIHTFDNSKTPAAGDAAHRVQTVAVDVAAIKAQLGDAIAETEANDPEKLREQIAHLEQSLKTAGNVIGEQQRITDGDRDELIALRRAKSKVSELVSKVDATFDIARRSWESAERNMSSIMMDAWRVVSALKTQLDTPTGSNVVNVGGVPEFKFTEDHYPASKPGSKKIGETKYHSPSAGETRPGQVCAEPQQHEQNGSLVSASRAVGGHARGVGGGGNRATASAASGKRSAAERVLDALRWWSHAGWLEPRREMVAFVAGYSPKSSGFEKTLSNLRTGGMIDFPSSGRVNLTSAGIEAALIPKEGLIATHELYKRVDDVLSSDAMWNVLEVLLIRLGKPITREALAAESNYSDRSSGYEKTLSTLRSLGLIKYPSKGTVACVPWLLLEDGE